MLKSMMFIPKKKKNLCRTLIVVSKKNVEREKFMSENLRKMVCFRLQSMKDQFKEPYEFDDYLYKDRIEEDDICKREQTSNPNLNNYWLYNTLRYGSPSNNHTNQFDFNLKVRFKSVDDCGGYGKVYFRFKLIDWDTGADTTTSDIEVIIYGCGDGNCTPELEDSVTCQEDCQ